MRAAARAIVFGVLFLALAPIPKFAAFAESPPTPKRAVQAARAQLDAARLEVGDLANTQRALARKVDALKREAPPGAPRSAELGQLLTESVQIEETLEAADARRREAERAFVRVAMARIAAIDEEMRARAPRLKVGSREARRSQALALKALGEERASLRRELSALEPRFAGDERWASYRVRADPLDGPRELREKADFIEDARDKLEKKRAALAQLVDRARRSRRLERTAREFAADARLFDEETRPGRILRGSGRRSIGPDDGDPDASEDTPTFSAPPGRVAGPEVDRAPQDNLDALPSPGTVRGPSIGSGGSGGVAVLEPPQPATPIQEAPSPAPTPAPVAPPPPAPGAPPPMSAPVVRDLGVLLQLDPVGLDVGAVDPAALEALLEELRAVDAELARSAEALRARAADLD